MALAAFDTLEFVDTLEKAGIPEPQARAMSVAVRKAYESSDVATKGDIAVVRNDMEKLGTELRHEIGDLRHEIGDLRKDMDAKLANMKFELLRWFFGIAVAQTGLLVALKFWV